MLPRNIKRAFRHLPELLMLRFGKQYSMEGVKLVVPGQDGGRAEILKVKVATALRLIKNHTQKHYERIERFIPNILISGGRPSCAVYISDLKLCDISREFALSGSTSAHQMAMTLVHEATHGYLESRGVLYAEDQRARIERICVQTEIAFASRLPQADALVTEAQRRLDYGPEYWTDVSFFQREVEDFTKAGMPRFFIRLLERAQSRRLQTGPGKKTQPDAAPNSGPATQPANSEVTEGPPSVS